MELASTSAESCPFCRIVRGEASAAVLHKDSQVLAFRDARPVAPIHILIIPLKHIDSLRNAGETADELLGHMITIASQLAEREKISASGYRLVINTGADAGQSVFHLHLHMMAGRPFGWPPG